MPQYADWTHESVGPGCEIFIPPFWEDLGQSKVSELRLSSLTGDRYEGL